MSHEAVSPLMGRRSILLPHWVEGDALFHDGGRRRLLLVRRRRDLLGGSEPPRDGQWQRILWIGMNPSTATATFDDPTCRLEWMRSFALGADTYVKVNLSDYRATRPSDIPHDSQKACSRRNVCVIEQEIGHADAVVLAWGAGPRALDAARNIVIGLIRAERCRRPLLPVLCLGVTRSGEPRHPLYVPRCRPLIPYYID